VANYPGGIVIKLKGEASKTNFKTIMEWCPSEENLKLAVRAIARKQKIITADNLHQLDHSVMLLGKDTRIYGSLLRELANEGFLTRGNIVYSSREICHHRYLIEWHHVEGT
jgi:hypothetical protein